VITLVIANDPTTGWYLVDSAPYVDTTVVPALEQQFDGSICVPGMDALENALGAQANSFRIGMQSARGGANGCRYFLRSGDGASKGNFIWRFGVLLAGDASAHTLLPPLPVAQADEIAAAG
jgi:hypothetical protein